MNKALFAGAAAMYFCALGVAAYTDVSNQLHGTASSTTAAFHETIDRDDQEIGHFNVFRLCEDSFTVPGYSTSSCMAAYRRAYQRGDFDHALKFATIGCERDKDRVQCRKANITGSTTPCITNVISPPSDFAYPRARQQFAHR